MGTDVTKLKAEEFVRGILDDMEEAHQKEMSVTLREIEEFKKAIKSPVPMLFTSLSAASTGDDKGRLTGYDMVTAITENTINSQLLKLWGQGKIKKIIDVHLSDQGGQKLHAEIDAPTITMAIPGSNTKVCLLLPLKSGFYSFWTFSGGKPVQAKKSIDNWVLAFEVNLGMKALERNAIENNKSIPDVVKKSLSEFTDDYFTISHTFLDLENANLANLDPDRSKIPNMDPNEFQQFISLFQGYVNTLRGNDNPFILGYSIDSKDTCQTQGTMPLFAPTGVTYSTSTNSQNTGLGTLNYNLMTDKSAFPTQPTAGIYNSPWVTNSDIQGTMAVSAAQFRQKYIGNIILPTISQYAAIPGSWWRDGETWKIKYDYKGEEYQAGTDSGLVPIYGQASQARSCEVTLLSGARPVIEATGRFYMKFDFWENILGGKLWSWCSVQVNWKITIDIGPGMDGGELTVSISCDQIGDTVKKQDEHWLYKATDLIAWLFNAAVSKQLAKINEEMSQLSKQDYQSMEENAERDFRAVKKVQVLPAGDVFFMKDAQLDTERNLLLHVTYKD